ncbi:MAG TPA: hypothetical protein VIA10_11345 [Gaiellaceae bacterium]
MDLFAADDNLDEDEPAALLERLWRWLAETEIKRRFLHERIDLLREERVRRLSRLRRAGRLAVDRCAPPPARRLFTGTGTTSIEPLGGLPDLATLGLGELHAWITRLSSLEDDVSLERRVLHARIDRLAGT